MYNLSFDVAKFEKYALPQVSGQNVMPDDRTVVSIDKDGNPISYFGDDSWDFNAFFNLSGEMKSKYQIKFFIEQHQPKLLIELKQRIYFLIWGEKGELLDMKGETFRKFSQCRSVAIQTELTLRCFKDTAIDSFSMLSNELVFSQILHSVEALSEKSILNVLHALSVLTQVNKHFPLQSHFSLGLPEGKSIKKIAKQYASSGSGHYPTIIPAIYEQLMGRLVQDVSDAHEKLSDLSDVIAYAKKYGLTEKQAVNYFWMIEGACFMACSAFTGMRIIELTQIDLTSYKEIDLDGIQLCTLRSWTTKLEKLPREDVWACAPICKKALAVLTVLNDNYRSKKGDIHCSPRFIFDGHACTGDNIINQSKDIIYNTTNLRTLFQSYSEYLDIAYEPESMNDVYRLLNPYVPERYNPITERKAGGLYWRFTTHSLRRTFAHFVVGNGLVSLAALKHQFKHISITMTAIYTSHAEVLTLMGIENPANIKKAIEEAEMESHKAYLRDMIDNPEDQSGGFMKAFEGDPKVLTEAQFESLAKQTQGANKSTGYGRCFAGFKCKMEHLFEPQNCLGRDCENLNINQAEAKRWQERHQRVVTKLQQMKNMGFYNRNTLARELTDIRAAEKVMQDHNIEFKRFELMEL